MKLANPALLSFLSLTACVPTLELREGPERERLVDRVRQYCAAELSADPSDTAPLFVASMRELLDRRAASDGPEAACEPGRVWYRGGSRLFAEVRRGDRSDRLDFWRGELPLIRNVLYGRRRLVDGRKVGNLWEELATGPGARSAAAVPPSPPPPPDTECFPPYYRFGFLATDTNVYRQGAVVRVTPTLDKSPAGTHALPIRCTTGWSVTGPATLSPDRTTVTFAQDAPPGSIVTVTYSHGGAKVEARFKVIARDEVVLTGRYSQSGLEGCSSVPLVGELEFQPENRFAVTYTPFETYQDYWGTYSFDPATKRLRLTVEGGNFVPSNLDLEGEAEMVEGRLRLTGLFLGSRFDAPLSGCTYVF